MVVFSCIYRPLQGAFVQDYFAHFLTGLHFLFAIVWNFLYILDINSYVNAWQYFSHFIGCLTHSAGALFFLLCRSLWFDVVPAVIFSLFSVMLKLRTSGPQPTNVLKSCLLSSSHSFKTFVEDERQESSPVSRKCLSSFPSTTCCS